MKIAIVYIFPNLQAETYLPMAKRFVSSWMSCPPGETDHELHVFINGPKPRHNEQELFDPLSVKFHQHNNWAKDIGAFMVASKTIACDLLICLGAHVWFHQPCWLDRIVQVYCDFGPALYGCWGVDNPAPHIRTTAFWLPPDLLASYPFPMDNEHRYNFEHGRDQSILQWAKRCGYPATMVTTQRVLSHPFFDVPSPQESLMLDKYQPRPCH